MQLTPYVYICESCQEIFEYAPHGYCVRCVSSHIFSLTSLLSPAEDRQRWLQQIGVARPPLRPQTKNKVVSLATERKRRASVN
jgi:hypothetical protein